MNKTILITGATDGIGLGTAKRLASEGHHVLLHGRSTAKLEAAAAAVGHGAETYLCDLSRMADIADFADAVASQHTKLDVVINNAGVFNAPTGKGLDIRFVVNTLAPAILTRRLLPLLGGDGRVVNLSSAAQSPVYLASLRGEGAPLGAGQAYAQSKLAMTMWSMALAEQLGADGPMVVAVNPGSLLGSKMVKEAFGVAGADIAIGVDILCRAALSAEFENASGKYYDNDAERFGHPHADARDPETRRQVVEIIEELSARY